jgi:hypothetical protein
MLRAASMSNRVGSSTDASPRCGPAAASNRPASQLASEAEQLDGAPAFLGTQLWFGVVEFGREQPRMEAQLGDVHACVDTRSRCA